MKSKGNVETLFSQYKERYTFEDWHQAKLSMDGFLDALRADPQYRIGHFLPLMEEQCMEAVGDAQRDLSQIGALAPLETLEWHIDPSGVALEKRLYDITCVDELTVKVSPSHRFPSDYTRLVLGASREHDTIDIGTFRGRTGLTAEEVYYLIRQLPEQAYTGRPRALSRVKISEGAMYYYLEYGASQIDAYMRMTWPRMYATKGGIKHI